MHIILLFVLFIVFVEFREFLCLHFVPDIQINCVGIWTFVLFYIIPMPKLILTLEVSIH